MIRLQGGGTKGAGRSQMTMLPCCVVPSMEWEGYAGHWVSHSERARLALVAPWAQPHSSFPLAHQRASPRALLFRLAVRERG